MKCLIIAAGKGSRLWQRGNTKPLVPLLGIPLIERVIRSAADGGIEDFYVVSGYNGDQLRPFLDGLTLRCNITMTHLINEDWEQDNGLSVLKAKEHLREPFLLLMADHLFDPDILRELINRPPGQGEITLAVDGDMANELVDMDDVTRVRHEDGKLVAIGKDLADFNGFDTGLFLCTPALFGALERNGVDQGDTTLSGGVRSLAEQGRVNVLGIDGRFWLDVDDPKALAKGERVLLARMRDKPNDGPVSRYLNRPISVWLSRYLVRLPITPNQISLLSFFGFTVAAVLLAMGGYPALVAGGAVAQLASILDGCDGEVARLKFQESEYGGWFDAVLDRYGDAFLLFGLTWHALAGGVDKLVLFTGFLAIIGSFMLSYTADKYDRLMRPRFTTGKGLRMGRDIRVFLIFLGVLFNQPYGTLLVIAALMNGEVVRRVWVSRDRG